MLDRVQKVLNFEGAVNPQFRHTDGLGRVGVAGFVTGLVLGVHLTIAGCCLALSGLVLSSLLQWSLYACSLSFFHFSEFFVTAVFKPRVVSYNSFVLNHSREYTGALLASWAEFWLEALFLPGLKRRPFLVAAGLLFILVGHWFRIGAMCTAGSNFDHQIMLTRDDSHQLVTHGVYRYLRHPSYFGWFWWSIGTQLVLCNPACFAVYAAAASTFFRRRIPYEESLLDRFYPREYAAYAERTFVGIPFVPSRSRRAPDSVGDVPQGVEHEQLSGAGMAGGSATSRAPLSSSSG